ncbi:delta-like protein 4 isoform X2 [Asterias rubens]|uniref:delta-like protein 4 isoform X2 n=1 Tax=Asterias rubens TaxID=7604 RepID=UPI001455B5BF|nr:delta-like protein 4 isoform X2 [Asterias rubens]
MGGPTTNGLWSALVMCLLVVSCLTLADCVELSKLERYGGVLHRLRRDDGCDGGRCLNGGTCTLWWWDGLCVCPDTHTGRYCGLENPCYDNPCQNGGSCFPDVTGLLPDAFFVCLCPEGRSGLNCETVSTTSSCLTDSCENGGTCFTFEDLIFCDCAPGFTGLECEQIDACSTMLCPDSHFCVSDFGVGHCLCIHDDVWGPDCVIDTDGNNGCANDDPCLNGGTCDDTTEPGIKVCWCPPGYDGLYCENAVTSSLPCNDLYTPCANGGTCELYGGNYYCHCTTEYSGENCTESIYYSLCLDYCEHGGSCYVDESAPHCVCTPRWKGRRCSVPVTDAPEPDCVLPCGDYGSCRLGTNRDQYCSCLSGWIGDQCQTNFRPTARQGGVSWFVFVIISGVVFVALFALGCLLAFCQLGRKRQRQQSHSNGVPAVIYDPRFGTENGGFVQVQARPNPSSLPSNDMYGSSPAKGSNKPKCHTTSRVRNNNYTDDRVARNPVSAYQYAYGASPPARKTPRSTVPPESHEYAYVSGDYRRNGSPTATRPTPSTAAPSIAASAEHTYQSLSEFGDGGRSNKR